MSSREKNEAKVTVLLLLNNVVMPMLLRTTGRRLGSARLGGVMNVVPVKGRG